MKQEPVPVVLVFHQRDVGVLFLCVYSSMGQKKSLTEARLSINDQTEPQHPQHLQRLLTQLDL